MKPLDWILLIAVAALVALDVVSILRRRGRGCGRSGISCGVCAGCPMYGQFNMPEKK